MRTTYRGYVSGLKWAGLKQALFEGALIYDLKLTILEEDKGWLRTTIYYELEGEAIDAFLQQLAQVAEQYNIS